MLEIEKVKLEDYKWKCRHYQLLMCGWKFCDYADMTIYYLAEDE